MMPKKNLKRPGGGTSTLELIKHNKGPPSIFIDSGLKGITSWCRDNGSVCL